MKQMKDIYLRILEVDLKQNSLVKKLIFHKLFIT